MASQTNALISFLIVRLIAVFCVQTWFVPDEFWQATEVAHKWVYGYGHLTWEWQTGIRSVLYPSIWTILLVLLKLMHLDYVWNIINLPRIVSAIWFAVGDFNIWKLSHQMNGHEAASCTGLLLSSSWFLLYCSPRTLSSCCEMVLVAFAFKWYPWRSKKYSLDLTYLLWTGLACVIRPTAALPVIGLYLSHLIAASHPVKLLLKSLLYGVSILTASIFMDSLYYGFWTVVPLNFMKLNVISSLASFYGTHSWHWYLSQGLPITLLTHVVPVMLGVCFHFKKHFEIAVPCLLTITILSLLPHKEFRFLLPVLPLLLCIGGDWLASFLKLIEEYKGWGGTYKMAMLLFLLVPNIIAFLYFGMVHQRGPLDAVSHLRGLLEEHPSPSVLILMPCHSTPLFSHLHLNAPVQFLTCEPNLEGEKHYMDEADIFFEDPLGWLQKTFQCSEPACRMLPSHVLLFSQLSEDIGDFIHHYSLCGRIFHSHFVQERQDTHISIYCHI